MRTGFSLSWIVRTDWTCILVDHRQVRCANRAVVRFHLRTVLGHLSGVLCLEHARTLGSDFTRITS